MTEIYLHIVARMADDMATHPYIYLDDDACHGYTAQVFYEAHGYDVCACANFRSSLNTRSPYKYDPTQNYACTTDICLGCRCARICVG